eukprot:TRINITY_DN9735_c0_g1_i3.p1 TRINITY_DN9735_c0_g1~~TRINITY_DN9735_c0_g1_i3.p1  ORF type:complete len:404 (+),score=60.85 TRINITY_DN9735_c0_g1_i3:47-1213(+)
MAKGEHPNKSKEKMLFLEQLRYCYRRDRAHLFELDLIAQLSDNLELPNLIPATRRIIFSISPKASDFLVERADALVGSLFLHEVAPDSPKMAILQKLHEWVKEFFTNTSGKDTSTDDKTGNKPFEQLHDKLCEIFMSDVELRDQLGRMFLLGVKRYLNSLNDWGDMGTKFCDRPDYPEFGYFLHRLKLMFRSGNFPRDMSLYVRPHDQFTKYLSDDLHPFWNDKLKSHVIALLKKARPSEEYRKKWYKEFGELSCETAATMIETNLITEAWFQLKKLRSELGDESIWRLGLLWGLKIRHKKPRSGRRASIRKDPGFQIPFAIDDAINLVKKELGGAWDEGFIEHLHNYFSPSCHREFEIDFTPYILGIEIGRAVQQECRDRSRMPSSA